MAEEPTEVNTPWGTVPGEKRTYSADRIESRLDQVYDALPVAAVVVLTTVTLLFVVFAFAVGAWALYNEVS